MRKGLERAASRRALPPLALLGCLVFAGGPATAQPMAEPDPCAHAFGPDLAGCWSREAERADEEMTRAYRALRQRLPGRAAKSLEKAQKLWLEFRDEHLKTLYGVESPVRTWGRDYPICLAMSQVALTRARTRELLKILEPDEESLCPL